MTSVDNKSPLSTPKPNIDVSVQEPEWETFENVETLVKMVTAATLGMAILPPAIIGCELETSIVLANDDLVHILNREYREKDQPTNVLTFATLDDKDNITPEGENLNLGDVILSYQTIEREAQEQGKFMLDHLKHLIVHGVLHLLGYDHQDDERANDMETLEIRILESLGVQNPYIEMEF